MFRVAITGDFLGPDGKPAYGDGLAQLLTRPLIQHHFLADQIPAKDDADYWAKFYSLQLGPEHIAGANGIVVLRPGVTRATFARGAGDLVVIGRSGAGYDKVDVQACTDNDVALFTAPMALNHPTASTALLFMLALAKKLSQQERITRQGRWDLQAEVMGDEIQGRTLGIIGLGHSGRELVRLVAPFAMRVLAYSPSADPAEAGKLGVRLVALDELLREADFVSLHCRLTEQTRRLLGERELRLMKPTAYLVNVARGPIVDQTALVAALRAKRIAGAGLDVFEVEPPPPDEPLLALDNVIVTPHWCGSTTDVWRGTGAAMAEGMLRVACGKLPDNVVNRDVLDRPGFRAKLERFEKQ
ncbi:MAG: dehydrogenase [Planctomycetes bacterium]|nr:dehydrogenase [Planctomycetota bacterium]